MDTTKTPKRIIFYSWDAIGHINPLISIAKELKSRGHYVCFVTSHELKFKDNFLESGLEFHHCVEQDKSANTANINVSALNELKEIFSHGPRSAFTNIYKVNSGLGKRMDELIAIHDIIEAKLKELKPDLIIVDTVHGIPCTNYVAPKWVRFFSAFPTILLSNLNDNVVAGLGLTYEEMMKPENKQFEVETKQEVVAKIKQFFVDKGLQAWPGKIEISPTSLHLNFCLGPDELSLDNDPRVKQPLGKNWIRLEHTLDDPDSNVRFDLPEKLINLPGKLIYFSLGTLVTSDTDMINRLLSILAKSKHRYIVSMGHLHQNIKLHSNMWGQKYIDQKAVLPKIDLFITHGGHNSIIEAFYYGVPGLIVLPVFADQFDLAQRVQDCGFGLRLSPYKCTEGELLDAIESVTSNVNLPNLMRSTSLRLRSIQYHKIASDHLESLLV